MFQVQLKSAAELGAQTVWLCVSTNACDQVSRWKQIFLASGEICCKYSYTRYII